MKARQVSDAVAVRLKAGSTVPYLEVVYRTRHPRGSHGACIEASREVDGPGPHHVV
jgi:hypothetical protein